MRGKINQWKDEKGFGFIVPDDGTEKVFFHISAVKSKARRPKVGDVVNYDATRDSKNRLKALAVSIEGVATSLKPRDKSIDNRIEPPKNNIFDYVLIVVLLVSLTTTVGIFFKSQRIEDAIPIGIPALIAIILLGRQKKPKDKEFSCSRCNKITEHDARTIKAWNNGFLKLYCHSCHQQWLIDNPTHVDRSNLSRSGGCLGVFVFLAVIPMIAGVGLYQWLS
jgi:cold shock CspA family protein